MPEAPAAPPEVSEPSSPLSSQPQQPLTAPPDPEMQARLDALMKKTLPVEGDEPAGEPTPEPDKDGKAATTKPLVEGLRLAPDLDAPPVEEPPKEPEILITDEMIVAEKSPKKQADMKKFRESYETLRQEVERLKKAPAQPAADPNAPDLSAVVEQQKQQMAQLTTQLQRFTVQADPLFQQQLIQPRNQMFGEALAVVKDAGGDAEAFERAWHAGDAKSRIAMLDDVIEDIKSPTMRAQLENLIVGINTKDRQIASALKDAKGTAERLKQQATVSQHEQLMAQEKQLKSLLNATTQQLTEGLETPDGGKLSLQVLQKTGRKEYEWWDKQVDDIHETAEEILLKGTPHKMATAAVLAAAAGPLNTLLIQYQRYAKSLEAKLAAIDGADPGNLNGKPSTTTAEEFAPDADITQVALTRLKRGDFNKAA